MTALLGRLANRRDTESAAPEILCYNVCLQRARALLRCTFSAERTFSVPCHSDGKFTDSQATCEQDREESASHYNIVRGPRPIERSLNLASPGEETRRHSRAVHSSREKVRVEDPSYR